MLSYNSIYIPGYTGFIPNLESVIGETYGNATRKLLMKRAKLLRLRRTAAGAPEHRYLFSKTSGQPHRFTQLSQDRNDMYEYTDSNGYSFAQRYNYDSDPQTTSAIQSTAKVKADLKETQKLSESRLLLQTKPEHKIPSSARPGISLNRNISEKISGTTIPKTDKAQSLEEARTSVSNSGSTIQKRRGKLIYGADCGFLPNYTGYIPGHKFSFGKTWGASTRDSLERGKRQPFMWTSFV